MEDWVSVAQICEALQVDERTVRRWLREERLKGINFGGKLGWRIRRAEFDRFIEELERKTAA